jgi:hypothetical protein
MQDDIRPLGGRKPKVIEPISQPVTPPLESISDEAVEEPQTEDFSTPPAVEPVTAVEPSTVTTEDDDELSEIAETSGGDMPKKKFKMHWPPTKKEWLIIVAALVLLIGGGVAAFVALNRDTKPVANKTTVKKAAPKPKLPTTVPSKLSGLPVEPSVNLRPVTGVMIENSLDARPQSGLDQASIVFEAIAEGGVTRFFALFQDTQPDYIGPVRSARPYYIQWCLSFDCSYAHVGGSPDGLADIKAWGVKDLDQFANSGAYHRISSRYAPHNVYTSIGELNNLENSKGYGASTFTGFSRKTEQVYKAPNPSATGKAAKNQDTRTPATSIDFALSGYYYNPHFDYDAASNTYKRSEAGQPHMEQHQDGSQVQISPKVVIGMVVPMSQGALDSSGAYYSNYQAVGNGEAYVFQDGTVTKIHWSKPDIKSELSFTDDAGKAFKLNAGQTWITALTDASKASYK